MKRIILSCFLVLVMVGFAFAAVDNNKVQELGARYDYIACRVNLVQSQATLLSTYGTISGTDKITSDFTQLKGLADSGNPTSFNTQVQAINTDFKTVNDELKTARQALSKSNISQSDRDTLKSEWNSTLQTYQSCNIAARKEIVSARIEVLQSSIDNWNGIIVNMTEKGLNTTELTSVVSDAQKLLSDLNTASQATDDASFKTMLDNANDEQNHLWARFAIGRINSNIAHIEPIIGQANLSGDLDQLNSLLNTASSLATPGKKYGTGEFQQTWQDIKDASGMLNTMSKDLRTFEQAARQNGILGNYTGPRNMTNRPIKGNMTGLPPRGNMTNRTPRGNFTRPPRENITGPRPPIERGKNQFNPGGNPPQQLGNISGDGQ